MILLSVDGSSWFVPRRLELQVILALFSSFITPCINMATKRVKWGSEYHLTGFDHLYDGLHQRLLEARSRFCTTLGGAVLFSSIWQICDAIDLTFLNTLSRHMLIFVNSAILNHVRDLAINALLGNNEIAHSIIAQGCFM